MDLFGRLRAILKAIALDVGYRLPKGRFPAFDKRQSDVGTSIEFSNAHQGQTNGQRNEAIPEIWDDCLPQNQWEIPKLRVQLAQEKAKIKNGRRSYRNELQFEIVEGEGGRVGKDARNREDLIPQCALYEAASGPALQFLVAKVYSQIGG